MSLIALSQDISVLRVKEACNQAPWSVPQECLLTKCRWTLTLGLYKFAATIDANHYHLCFCHPDNLGPLLSSRQNGKQMSFFGEFKGKAMCLVCLETKSAMRISTWVASRTPCTTTNKTSTPLLPEPLSSLSSKEKYTVLSQAVECCFPWACYSKEAPVRWWNSEAMFLYFDILTFVNLLVYLYYSVDFSIFFIVLYCYAMWHKNFLWH